MRKWFVVLALACGCVVALVNFASAQVQIQIQVQPDVQVQAAQIQIQPVQIQAGRAIARPGIMPYIGGNQLTQADAVFVGRVVALEPMDVEAPQVANGPKVNYRIAVVQITESIFGLKKDTKMVRVGFIAQANNGPVNGPGGGIQILPVGQPAIQLPGGGLRRPFPGNFQQQIPLQVGQDGLFTVNKHAKENFYLSPNFQNFVTRENNPNFDTSVKTAKQLSKVMGDPVASLKSNDKQDRYAAAAILISKYRNPNNPTGQPFKQEPIDAAESKLILKALAEGDWKVSGAIPGSIELFNRLGVTPNDGWNNGAGFRTQEEFAAAMHKWLDENNGKYRIQKHVVDANAKDPPAPPRGQPGGIQPIRPPAPPIEGNLLPGQQPAPPQPIRRN
jgi:hypothetical protein